MQSAVLLKLKLLVQNKTQAKCWFSRHKKVKMISDLVAASYEPVLKLLQKKQILVDKFASQG